MIMILCIGDFSASVLASWHRDTAVDYIWLGAPPPIIGRRSWASRTVGAAWTPLALVEGLPCHRRATAGTVGDGGWQGREQLRVKQRSAWQLDDPDDLPTGMFVARAHPVIR